MKLHYCSNFDQMSQYATENIIADLKANSKQLICTATGASPIGLYQNLADINIDNPGLFDEVQILKLDEWGGISSNDPNSCESFIQSKILKPLDITEDRYISFKSNSHFPEKECEKIQEELNTNGPIDICILGLGKNGHIGFNEPAEYLSKNCHVAQLSYTSQQHEMMKSLHIKPSYGLTIGMADIIQSKKIILLITGCGKKTVIEQLLTGIITTKLPASFLWLHSNLECYIDSNSIL